MLDPTQRSPRPRPRGVRSVAMPAVAALLLMTAATGHAGRGERPPSVTLEAPTDLTVVRYKPDVVLRWAHAGTFTRGYEVERAVASGPFRRVGAPGRNARTFRDAASSPGLMYVYRIRAVGVGSVSPYSTELIVIVNPDPPGRPGARTPNPR
jgi:hypothetical protein